MSLISTLVHPQSLCSSAEWTAADVRGIVDRARRLPRTHAAQGAGRPLSGRHLALLGATAASGNRAVRRAAADLGARVATLDLGPPAPPDDEFRKLSRMLGRFYDVVDSGNLRPEQVRDIKRHAGVPVCDGIGRREHPARALADIACLDERSCQPIRFVGDIDTDRGRVLARMAALLGIELLVSGTAGGGATCGLIDATCRSAWRLRVHARPVGPAERGDSHRRVLQAILLFALEN